MVKLPSHREFMDQVKVEVLRLVGEKAVEFQGEQLYSWSGAMFLKGGRTKG